MRIRIRGGLRFGVRIAGEADSADSADSFEPRDYCKGQQDFRF